MDLPVWGIAVIALYSLLQIPAVVFLARYCEVDAEDLPTPPTRSLWRDNESGDESPDAPPRATTEKSAAEPTPDRTVTRNTAPPSETAADNGVRCSHCGAANDSGYERCRRCTKRL